MMIPENFTNFLDWFKTETELSWAKISPTSEENWIRGARWIGLEESKIDEIETKYQIRFTPDHREFLKRLHTTDKRYAILDETGAVIRTESLFYNWLTDEEEIRYRLQYPYEVLLFDKIWLKSWGAKRSSDAEQVQLFEDWYQKAPKLIPMFGHRFIVSEPCQTGNPVLSVWGRDTIIYGWNLRSYLLREFTEYLPDYLFQQVYDEEDKTWYKDFKDEVQAIFDKDWFKSSYDNIPCWGELIEQEGRGWKYQPGTILE